MYISFWYGISIIVAMLYVMSLQGTERLTSTNLERPTTRTIALFAWARMMMVLALFFGMVLYLSTLHFILVTIVFIITIWLLLWRLSKI